MGPPDDWGAKQIARNRELLALAADARRTAREAIVRAEHAVRAVMRARIARELSRRQPVVVPIERKHPDIP